MTNGKTYPVVLRMQGLWPKDLAASRRTGAGGAATSGMWILGDQARTGASTARRTGPGRSRPRFRRWPSPISPTSWRS